MNSRVLSEKNCKEKARSSWWRIPVILPKRLALIYRGMACVCFFVDFR